MSLLLNIDTATENASVCLAKDDTVLQLMINENQKDHAGWLHTAIKDLLAKNSIRVQELDAVAISIGPGSYTGLRVGLSSAKGLCFALNIPLITISTLLMIANAVKNEITEYDFICPMIDARRMEVYTALYDKFLQEKMKPCAMIIDQNSLQAYRLSNKIIFCGNGCKKLQPFITDTHSIFSNTIANASHLADLSYNSFQKKIFADLAYSEPNYIKEFYSQSTSDV